MSYGQYQIQAFPVETAKRSKSMPISRRRGHYDNQVGSIVRVDAEASNVVHINDRKLFYVYNHAAELTLLSQSNTMNVEQRTNVAC